MARKRRVTHLILPILLLSIALVASACSGSEARAKGDSEVFRLGIFPNLTHAPGHYAIGSGLMEDVMAPTQVEVTVFNSGSQAGQALLSGSIDGTYIGPTPAATLFQQSDGKVAVVSGAVSGGASLVVLKGSGIEEPSDLEGKSIAVPGVGNTQDVALRNWMHENGLKARDEGGNVSVKAIDNANLGPLFDSGQVDAAWEPEPYPSYLMGEGTAELFLDEADLWPDGRFVTTHLLVNTAYIDAHPDVVQKLVQANVEAIDAVNSDPDAAKKVVQAELIKAGAPSLDQSVIDAAWDKLEFTSDPLPETMAAAAQHAYELGVLLEDPTNIADIYRLDMLEAVTAGGTGGENK